MSGELIVGSTAVIGFAIGSAVWGRFEPYLRARKALIMLLCVGTVAISGKAAISWVQDMPDDSPQQVVAAVAVLGVLSASLGVGFFRWVSVRVQAVQKDERKGKKPVIEKLSLIVLCLHLQPLTYARVWAVGWRYPVESCRGGCCFLQALPWSGEHATGVHSASLVATGGVFSVPRRMVRTAVLMFLAFRNPSR